MKIAVFNTKSYDKEYLMRANQGHGHAIEFFEAHLNSQTAVLAKGFGAVCVFVNDVLDNGVIKALSENGTRLIVLRCAGFNNVDLKAAHDYGVTVLRVPAYSTRGVAEHALALMLTLNRHIHRAHHRVREGNFSLEGLLGFEMFGKTIGIIGTGKIGLDLARICQGLGMNVLGFDAYKNPQAETLGLKYVDIDFLWHESDIISLHVPLMPQTYHLINIETINKMKKGVMVINTSRGGLIDTAAVIDGLKSEKIGYLGLDVYEEEAHLFFEDLSGKVIRDDIFARLLTFPNVIITGHQAFFTQTALTNIANTTIQNVTDFETNKIIEANAVRLEQHLLPKN